MHFVNENTTCKTRFYQTIFSVSSSLNGISAEKKNKKVGLTTENLGLAKNQQANEIEPMPNWCWWVPRVQLMSDLT